MAAQANQHFVPQFYFRMFTGNDRHVHLLLKKGRRLVLHAPIKGQCARHRFYPAEIERQFSELEGQHSHVLRQWRDLAWSPPVRLEPELLAGLWQAVLFQRARTQLQLEKTAPAHETLVLEMLKEHVRRSPTTEDRDLLLQHLERGDITIKGNPQRLAAMAISSAMQSALLISDLNVHVLRNRTDYPFLFGDSPAVFYNTLYRNVTHRGVLGCQTPGLQIFFPVDSRTLIMLLDAQAYGGRYRDSLIINVDSRCDVSQMNALQLHHSHQAIYFADARDHEYVLDLWDAHARKIVASQEQFHNRKGWLAREERVDDNLYHVFEPHLNIRLALSFIECDPIHPANYEFRRRSPELYEEHRNRFKRA
jgi:hypothetical protein